ncbi:MAG: SDR family oxidoreductase [Mariniphaga sp.]|nr:SDR family oxidoreductase [Mariniphaga sp.]
MNNSFSLKGKTILVTGASSGIGKAVAIECSKSGAQLVITGRNEERLTETYHLLTGGNHLMITTDLSGSKGLDVLLTGLPSLNGVVHCAGIIKRLPLKFIKEEKLEELMGINFYVPALLTQQLYKRKLLKEAASIVFISSVASSFASIGNIMYMASKGAINSYMKGIAFELSSSGIRANAIQPGMIKTNLSSALSDEELAIDMDRYPLGRYGKPEEVAYAAIYLLSDATLWMTGSILTIDGGLTLR